MAEPTERPKCLLDLFAEVDAFDAELFPVNAPFDAGDDRVIGDVPPWARKLYALVRYFTRQANVLAAEREYKTADDFAGDEELCALRYKANLLNELMYFIIRSEIQNGFSTSCVGVRESWQVVSTTPDDDDDFEGFLRTILKRKKKG